MATPHTWTPEEELQWRTYQLPESLREHAEYNLRKIEEYVRTQGYIVETGLLDMLIQYSSDLRPRLRFSQPQTHSLADALVDALTSRPPTPPEPQPYAGTEKEKLIGTGVDVTGHILSVKDKAAAHEQVKQDIQMVLEEARKAKEQLQEQHYKMEAEALSVNNLSGTGVDHNFMDLLRQIFAKREDGSVCWVSTYEARLRYCEEHQWRREHGQPTSPNIPLRQF